jgi:hypothetical protein
VTRNHGRGRRNHLYAYRRERGTYLIEVKLRELRQLFNTLDPSPFHEKDLDPAAEEYLVSAARELGRHPSQLVFHVPVDAGSDARREVASAVRHYFLYRAWHTGEQLRLLLMRGLVSLAIGLTFLFACLSIRQLLDGLTAVPGKEIFSEGLLILGWVAMWRPVEIFLYDWWPEFGKRAVFLRIAGMRIEVRPSEYDEGRGLSQSRSKGHSTESPAIIEHEGAGHIVGVVPAAAIRSRGEASAARAPVASERQAANS